MIKKIESIKFCSLRIHSIFWHVLWFWSWALVSLVQRVLLRFHHSLSLHSWVVVLLPQSSIWRRTVFCFLKFLISEMELGTTAWQKRVFSRCFSNSSRIGQSKKSGRALEQGAAGFSAPNKEYGMYREDRDLRNSWTNPTSSHVNWCHVIWLPSKIYGLDRGSSVACGTTVTQDNPEAQNGQRILGKCLWNSSRALSFQSVTLCRTTRETLWIQWLQQLFIWEWRMQEDDDILIPALLLMITIRKLLSWEEIPAPQNSLSKESKKQAVPEGMGVFHRLNPPAVFSLPL